MVPALATLQAQVSVAGRPYSFDHVVPADTAVVALPRLDLVRIASIEFAQDKAEPLQFGYPFDVEYSLTNSGTWFDLPDGGRLWRLTLQSAAAYSINLLYEDFALAEGARLFIYRPDRTMVLGAFTAANNKPHGRFATAPLKGEVCILELHEPPAVARPSRLTIRRIVHGYKDIFFRTAKDFGESGACNININSSLGMDWQTAKRAVAMIVLGDGHRICTGALINNTAQDLTQYFLTANHCLGDEETWVFMFNYESPGAYNLDGPTNYTVQGATLIANHEASDFALLEINEKIPVDYNVHFAGWNAQSAPATRSVCIHHPNGDIKKISFDNQSPGNSSWQGTPFDSHWSVIWDAGTTEPGSSGSPLFDQNHRITGQLHGGAAACDFPGGADVFGKLALSWDYDARPEKQLKYWLDPQNSGLRVCNGRDNYSLQIVHTPLPATEDTIGPYFIYATIRTIRPPLRQIWLHYGYNGLWQDSVAMFPTGQNDEYVAAIPGGQAEIEINYYFTATDAGLMTVSEPGNAPANYFTLHITTDSEPPRIQHTAMADQVLQRWPPALDAIVTDNLGVDTVYCEYYVNQLPLAGTFGLKRIGQDQYSAAFPIAGIQPKTGDQIFYRLIARDKARLVNETSAPATGFYCFRIIEARGAILIVREDVALEQLPAMPQTKQATTSTAAAVFEHRQMGVWLEQAGYYVEEMPVKSALTTAFEDFDLVIAVSGADPTPFNSAEYRQKITSWVSNAKHKLLIEGGELGYHLLLSFARDSAFATNVLHISNWLADEAGDLKCPAEVCYHSLVHQPQALPATIPLVVESFADQDALTPLSPAYLVYEPDAQPGKAGVLVCDDNQHPQSAQIIFYAFNFAAIADTNIARDLLINSVSYLLQTENPAIGSISGQVDISQSDDESAVQVSLLGTIQKETQTDREGFYRFDDLYDGYYQVRISKTGYYTADSLSPLLCIAQNQITGIDFTIDPIVPAVIEGKVTLANSSDHSGVIVSVIAQGLSDTTTADGHYRIENLAPGLIRLEYRRAGYLTLQVDTLIANGAVLTLGVVLQKDLPMPQRLVAQGLEGAVALSWQAAGTLAEDFENGLPADWIIYNLGDNHSGSSWRISDNYQVSGSQAALCPYSSPGERADEWLITRSVQITPATHVLKFWHVGTFTGDDNLPNHIRISATGTDTADFNILKTFPGLPDALPAEWTQVVIDLSAYLGQMVRIAFQYQSIFGENWYLDDIILAADTTRQKSTKPLPEQVQTIAKTPIYTESQPIVKVPVRNAKSLQTYRIYRAESAGVFPSSENYLNAVDAAQLSYTDSAVINGRDYYYIVVADYAGDGLSAVSNEVSARPINLPPPGPTNLALTLIDTLVHLTWTEVEARDLFGYQVYRRGPGDAVFLLIAEPKGTQYCDTLSADGVYYYYVTAVDNGTPSLSSPATPVRVARYGKLPPLNLVARSNCNQVVPLTWAPPDWTSDASKETQPVTGRMTAEFWDSNVKRPAVNGSLVGKRKNQLDYTGFRLYRSLTTPVIADTANLLVELEIDRTDYRDSSVSNAVCYHYAISAVYGSAGESALSNEVMAIPSAPLAPFHLVVVSRIDTVSLAWSDLNQRQSSTVKYQRPATTGVINKRADFYTVYRCVTGGAFVVLADSLTLPGYRDAAVESGSEYRYYLTACLGGSYSAPSETLSVRVLGHDQVIFYDDFESGRIASGYRLLDADGGLGFVQYSPDLFEPFAWRVRQTPSFPALSGHFCLGTGYNLDGRMNDDWLIFPAVQVSDSAAFFETFLSSQDANYLETAQILIAPAAQPPLIFDTLLVIEKIPADPAWLPVQIDLSPYAGQQIHLAVRCISTDRFVLKLDNAGFYGYGRMLAARRPENQRLPDAFWVSANCPNPFNAVTKIVYHLPRSTEVTLTIYDLRGQKVRTLVRQPQAAGVYSVEWDSCNEQGEPVASGVYWHHFSAGDYRQTRKMLLIK